MTRRWLLVSVPKSELPVPQKPKLGTIDALMAAGIGSSVLRHIWAPAQVDHGEAVVDSRAYVALTSLT
jgi:hypothetical protein